MTSPKVLAADIPTSESLKLTSNATESPQNAPPLPRLLSAESKLKRDDWMLEPEIPVVDNPSSQSHSKPRIVPPDEEMSLTEEYGDLEQSKRTLGGGVDFFSSLGTEHKKKRPEKPDPNKVRVYYFWVGLNEVQVEYNLGGRQLSRAQHPTDRRQVFGRICHAASLGESLLWWSWLTVADAQAATRVRNGR